MTIDGIRGQPFTIGIEIDEEYDVARLANVQFWPYGDYGPYNVTTWRLANGVEAQTQAFRPVSISAIISMISENQCVGFYQSTNPSAGWGTSLRHQWSNVYCDGNVEGIHIDSSITSAGSISVQASNTVLFGNSDAAAGSLGLNGYNNYAPGVLTRFDFSNLEISNYQRSLFYGVAGSADNIRINNLRVEQRNLSNGGWAGFNSPGTFAIANAVMDTSGATTPLFAGNVTVDGVRQADWLVLAGANPSIFFSKQTTAIADQKVSDIVITDTGPQFRLCDDIYSVCDIWLQADRTGHATQDIKLGDTSWPTYYKFTGNVFSPSSTSTFMYLGLPATPWGAVYATNYYAGVSNLAGVSCAAGVREPDDVGHHQRDCDALLMKRLALLSLLLASLMRTT